jgi:vacuolar-type H+-ATPase subunit H
MEILQLVDHLEQVLNRGWRMPLTSSLVVNEEECLRLIDQMRISVPSAIKESERMIGERDRIIGEAHRRAESILSQAEEEAMGMVSQHFVVKEARLEAERIVEMGQAESMRLIQEAEDYALNVLKELGEQLRTSLHQAENGVRAIEESRLEMDTNDPHTAGAPPPSPTLPRPVEPKSTPVASDGQKTGTREETRPAQNRPARHNPAGNNPAAPNRSGDNRPETNPVENSLVESEPAENTPAENTPVESKPEESRLPDQVQEESKTQKKKGK